MRYCSWRALKLVAWVSARHVARREHSCAPRALPHATTTFARREHFRVPRESTRAAVVTRATRRVSGDLVPPHIPRKRSNGCLVRVKQPHSRSRGWFAAGAFAATVGEGNRGRNPGHEARVRRPRATPHSAKAVKRLPGVREATTLPLSRVVCHGGLRSNSGGGQPRSPPIAARSWRRFTLMAQVDARGQDSISWRRLMLVAKVQSRGTG